MMYTINPSFYDTQSDKTDCDCKEEANIARKKRNWYPGEIMHIMNRGSSHQNIFVDEMDYLTFLRLIKTTKEKYPFELHSYCLMTNHYHLLLETLTDDISLIMKRINEQYTRYFNVKYGRDGALFRGRFKSCEITDVAYFLQTSRYIALNPVKAGMVDLPEQYMWSNYRTYVGLGTDEITAVEKTLAYFGEENPELFKEFVEDGISYDGFAEKICSDISEGEE